MRKRTSPIWKMEKENFAALVKKSFSYAEIMRYWGFTATNNHKTLKARIVEEKLDISHFKQKRYNIAEYIKAGVVPLNKVLVENSTYSKSSLKRRVIKEGLITYECSICSSPAFWRGKPMILILDHINGVNNDNRLENLRFVCPNCNVQLDTNCGKNNKRKQYLCKNCGVVITKHGTYCNKCASVINGLAHRKIFRPQKDELEKMLHELPITKIGKLFSVSDSTIRKWAKLYDIQLVPRRGYWAKKLAGKI